jgi:hypothetical protein
VVTVTWGSGLIAGPVNRVIATMQNGVEVLRSAAFRPDPVRRHFRSWSGATCTGYDGISLTARMVHHGRR